ncbi:AAA family ATPase [Kribbella sp. NPDC056345]|uniref:phosphotransferase-like protein n=1 Tax=Kribbella sp. NPDC056345 TaxID=3345789 RepID=UPI0035D6578F
MQGELTVVSGTPGAGKSTVAALLASEADRPTVHLVTDQFFAAIQTGHIPPYRPEASQQNDVVVDAYVAAAATYARGGYDVVVDGVVGPYYVPRFRAAALNDGLVLSYVVLRPALEETIARAQTRGPESLRDEGAISHMYGAFAELGPLEHHALDTTDQSAAATAEVVRRGVAAGIYRLH